MLPQDLEPGDVLLMQGTAWTDFDGRLPFRIPISWLIRKLDGGRYSHASVWDGRHAWGHEHDWKLGPVELSEATSHTALVDVYRYPGLDAAGRDAVVAALAPHVGDVYDKGGLALAGLVAVLARVPRQAWRRALMRLLMTALARAIRRRSEEQEREASICTAVPSAAYYEAEPSPRLGLRVDLERSRRVRQVPDAGGRSAYARTQAELLAALSALQPGLRDQLAAYGRALGSNAVWVLAGSATLPYNFVSPADLEGSESLERRGRLVTG